MSEDDLQDGEFYWVETIYNEPTIAQWSLSSCRIGYVFLEAREFVRVVQHIPMPGTEA